VVVFLVAAGSAAGFWPGKGATLSTMFVLP
jgi:hypothetical protein